MHSMKRVIILTGSEIRHTFFRIYISSLKGVDVVASFCEGKEKNLNALVNKEDNNTYRLMHLQERERSEMDFFSIFNNNMLDKSNPIFIRKGEINHQEIIDNIIGKKPDLLIAYGCSLIKGALLNVFKGKFINVHLGLSPYYRGSGTNFWPFVNNELEYVGVTFMHIDEGIDTGQIIHQIRPRIFHNDSVAQIGNRLIIDMASVCGRIISQFDNIEKVSQLPDPKNKKLYRRKDFTEESVKKLYANLHEKQIERYIVEKDDRCKRVRIIENQRFGKES
jgi:phosphoribosylglycinamide formyltransferase 1